LRYSSAFVQGSLLGLNLFLFGCDLRLSVVLFLLLPNFILLIFHLAFFFERALLGVNITGVLVVDSHVALLHQSLESDLDLPE
jgi:hypothetical protein